MMSDWWENPLIGEIDEFVENHFDKASIQDYYEQFNAIHIADWKPQALRWIEDRKSMWDTLEELVEALPDDENEEYHSLTSKAIDDV